MTFSTHVRSDPMTQWPPGTLLGVLNDTDRAALLALGSERHHDRAETLTREGDPPGDVFILLDGCVKVLGDTRDGHTTLLAVRVPGDVLGELSAMDGRPRSATVITAVPAMTRVISRSELAGYLARRPSAAVAMHRGIAQKLRQATRFRIDLAGAPVVTRLARVLYQLTVAYGRTDTDGVLVDVPLSQQDLAALVGAAEVSIHRALAELRRAGVVATGYRRLLVRDPSQLRRRALDPT